MYTLIFFIILLQTFSHWIIKPLSDFLNSVFEIHILGFILIIIFLFFFSGQQEKNAG